MYDQLLKIVCDDGYPVPLFVNGCAVENRHNKQILFFYSLRFIFPLFDINPYYSFMPLKIDLFALFSLSQPYGHTFLFPHMVSPPFLEFIPV